jgi:hypothetical protein
LITFLAKRGDLSLVSVNNLANESRWSGTGTCDKQEAP